MALRVVPVIREANCFSNAIAVVQIQLFKYVASQCVLYASTVLLVTEGRKR